MFIVTESDYDYFNIHGVFSTQAKAEAYITMVEGAHKTAKVSMIGGLDFEQVEVDELENLFPVFSMIATPTTVSAHRVLFLREVPTTEVQVNGEIFSAVTTYGRTPAEAREKMLALKADYPDITRLVR